MLLLTPKSIILNFFLNLYALFKLEKKKIEASFEILIDFLNLCAPPKIRNTHISCCLISSLILINIYICTNFKE